jgi:hypothetical protein
MRGKGSARLIRNWRAAGAVTTGTAKRGRKQRDNANELLIAVVCVVMSETWGDICAVIRYIALLEEHVLSSVTMKMDAAVPSETLHI